MIQNNTNLIFFRSLFVISGFENAADFAKSGAGRGHGSAQRGHGQRSEPGGAVRGPRRAAKEEVRKRGVAWKKADCLFSRLEEEQQFLCHPFVNRFLKKKTPCILWFHLKIMFCHLLLLPNGYLDGNKIFTSGQFYDG